jgi:muramoyltetrapeptide carboxypeptidase
LLNAIYQKTGLITFHGDDIVWGLGHNATDYDRQEFLARLADGRIGEIPPNGPRRTIRPGTAEGRLLGGNIGALLKLAGTPYFPDFTGAIFFVESFNITPEICDYLFQHLLQMGVFDQIRGAIVGFNAGLEDDEKATMQMEDVLLQVTREYSFPVLKVNDFGHKTPNTTLPVGGRVRLDADARTVEILEPCVM